MDAHLRIASKGRLPTSKSSPVEGAAVTKQQQSTTPRELTRRRVAHWDSKREKCANCWLIYLKTLSQHPGFCSVDCKSNLVYLEKVNHTIRAMKDAVEERQRLRQEEEGNVDEVEEARQQGQEGAMTTSAKMDQGTCPHDERMVLESVDCTMQAQTFSEFGVKLCTLKAGNVEWSFSAMY
ncbi:hypothetical protein BBJ28_00001400 [Nothophytophthora sp. Chile5]|nr:hypothetical protein BBJ28_00001400 [Nothophytophthora sp. Chile5]